MSETRKLAAIPVADVVGYSRLAGVDEERTLARLRGLHSDLIDPATAAHHGRIIKRTGDGSNFFAFSIPSASGLEGKVEIFIPGMVTRRLGTEKLLPKLVLDERRKPQSFGHRDRGADGGIIKVS
jgi:class 3 adenylate cyclase